MSIRNSYLFFCLFLVLEFSCVKDVPHPDTYHIPNSNHKGVLMLNEGSYGNNNAELSFLDFESGMLSQHIYQTSNSSSLGDVAQSMKYHKGRIYIALNNSNKICVLDAVNFKEIAQIKNIQTPRYVEVVQDTLLYVSSLYQSKVTLIDLNRMSIMKSIDIDFPNSETMLQTAHEIWLTNWDIHCNYVYQINTDQHEVVNKFPISGFASHGIVQDHLNQIWVLSGNKYKGVPSFLTCLDATSGQIKSSFAFNKDDEPIKLSMNANKDSLFFIGINYDGAQNYNGFFGMSIHDTQLPETPMIQAASNSYFWAYGIDPQTHHIFISDPKGFTQQSAIHEYDSRGSLLRTFQGGIGTNGFLFNQ